MVMALYMNTPLEISLTSKVLTGVVAAYSSHPLPEITTSGLAFFINTDDPPIFHTDLVREYALAMYV